jgi:S-(hydroxymethyl)glutathione dehydrogenase/alcohol dehydrogenase
VGAGGLGSNVIQLARVFRAGEIVAVDIRDDKLEAARRLGATRVVNSARGESGGAVDVAFECLGRPETVAQAFALTRDGGTTVVLGVAPTGVTAPIEITRLVRRGIRLVGSFGCRVRTDMPAIVRLAASGAIDVAASVTRRYRLDQIQEAYDAMTRGDIVGRAIVVMG